MSKEKINSKTISCSRITESITLSYETRESQIYQPIQLNTWVPRIIASATHG